MSTLDYTYQTWIHTEVLYRVGDPISFLSALISLIPLATLFALFLFIAVPTHLARNAARLFIILLLNEAVCQILKRMMKQQRPLPPWDPATYETRGPQLGFGMPSSHTALVFCSAMTSTLLGKVVTVKFRVWRFGQWAIALLVAFSRVYNSYHTTKQVFIGALVGIVMSHILVRMRFLKEAADLLVQSVQFFSCQ